jgi:hypothetical protein
MLLNSEICKSISQAGLDNIIYIKERNFCMLKNELILQNPLRQLGFETDDILHKGGLGAVLARAGVGKTAFLVQLALNSMLRGKHVLHISLEDPVKKVGLWYKEVFSRIANQYQINQNDQLWDSILPNRFIMTFRVEGFSVPKLEERLTDLIEQAIFKPLILIIDGLPFDDSVGQHLCKLKALAESHDLRVWLAVRTHRHQEPGQNGTPLQLIQVADLFEVAIQLVPVGKQIQIKALRGSQSRADRSELFLDPSTMLVMS